MEQRTEDVMIYISTGMYLKDAFMKVMRTVEGVGGNIGIELFPMFHYPGFERELDKNLGTLRQFPMTFHEPYYGTEHSAPVGSLKYQRTMNYFHKMLKYEVILNPKYIVYHFNNCEIHDPEAMLDNSLNNLRELTKRTSTPIVIENTGVAADKNILLSEEEFINVCRKEPNQVLIDIGHAYASGWNLENVIRSLADKIISYHIHSNDGFNDTHERLFQNGPDTFEFLEMFKKYTPNADLVVEYGIQFEDREDEIIEDILKLRDVLGIHGSTDLSGYRYSGDYPAVK